MIRIWDAAGCAGGTGLPSHETSILAIATCQRDAVLCASADETGCPDLGLGARYGALELAGGPAGGELGRLASGRNASGDGRWFRGDSNLEHCGRLGRKSSKAMRVRPAQSHGPRMDVEWHRAEPTIRSGFGTWRPGRLSTPSTSMRAPSMPWHGTLRDVCWRVARVTEP